MRGLTTTEIDALVEGLTFDPGTPQEGEPPDDPNVPTCEILVQRGLLRWVPRESGEWTWLEAMTTDIGRLALRVGRAVGSLENRE